MIELTEFIQHAREEYARTLQIPLNGWERHYNQPYMCFLRDFIALTEGRDRLDVQEEYEAKVEGK